MIYLELVANVSYILAKNDPNSKNYMTIGKTFSNPTKPDQPQPHSFICLKVMVLLHQGLLKQF